MNTALAAHTGVLGTGGAAAGITGFLAPVSAGIVAAAPVIIPVGIALGVVAIAAVSTHIYLKSKETRSDISKLRYEM